MIPQRKKFILCLHPESDCIFWSDELDEECDELGRGGNPTLEEARRIYNDLREGSLALDRDEMPPFERYTYSSYATPHLEKPKVTLPQRKKPGGFRDCAGCGKFRIWIDEPPDLVKLHEAGYCQNGEFKWFHSALCLNDYCRRNPNRYKERQQSLL